MTNGQTKYRTPYGTGDYELVRHGAEGTYWQANDGLTVHVAAPERESRADTRGVLVAWLLPLLLLGRVATER